MTYFKSFFIINCKIINKFKIIDYIFFAFVIIDLRTFLISLDKDILSKSDIRLLLYKF